MSKPPPESPADTGASGDSRLQALIRRLAGESVVAKFVRFGIVGASSSMIFAVATVIAIRLFGAGESMASVVGYLASMPLNYLGNRSFSFRSKSRVLPEIVRFIAIHAFNILMTAITMHIAVTLLGLHYGYGIVAVMALIPVVNFALMHLWVFVQPQTPKSE